MGLLATALLVSRLFVAESQKQRRCECQFPCLHGFCAPIASSHSSLGKGIQRYVFAKVISVIVMQSGSTTCPSKSTDRCRLAIESTKAVLRRLRQLGLSTHCSLLEKWILCARRSVTPQLQALFFRDQKSVLCSQYPRDKFDKQPKDQTAETGDKKESRRKGLNLKMEKDTLKETQSVAGIEPDKFTLKTVERTIWIYSCFYQNSAYKYCICRTSKYGEISTKSL